MTCIATDGRSIAGDGRALIGQLITTDRRAKLVRMPDGSVAGLAGESTAGALVREWLSKGADMAQIPTVKPGEDPGTPFEALILRPSGQIDFLDWNFTLVRHDCPAAIGSGREVAVGLMLAGKTPGEAVRLVARRVASVGGRVVEMKPTKAKGRR